jgi:DNA-binding transcriptional regulator LsrR (DeoR family)
VLNSGLLSGLITDEVTAHALNDEITGAENA